MTFADLLDLPQYALSQREKERVLLEHWNALTEHHRSHCPDYVRLLEAVFPGNRTASHSSEVPFLPVGVFKSHQLRSIAGDAVFKTLTSSGTTGQQVSQIVLDAETARRQSAALARIVTHVLGPSRL